ASASASSSHGPSASCAPSLRHSSCIYGPNSYGGGVEPRFVDIHSHVVPSGDDGVQNVSEGLALARDAFEHGTGLLYATPHVSPALPLTEERERRIHKAFAELRERAPLELRLGFELTPMRAFLDEDPRRYVLEPVEYVLVDDGLAALVASDGHRATRPMLLDGAYELTRGRVGEERASRLFDGSALGLAVGTVPERGLSL